MFSFFQKKPTQDEAIATCRSLATNASIFLVLEGGDPTTLMINIKHTGASVSESFKFQEAVSAFVEAIEARISSGDYENPRKGLGLSPELLAMGRPVSAAERLVVSSEMKKLFSWRL